ncbi:UNVERIFIED_CONTAM: hypothetical protein NCL1_46830 [Trichonephila clavipes]
MTADNIPRSGNRTRNRKEGKLTSRRCGQLSNFFTDMTQVTRCPRSLFPLLDLSLPLRRFGGDGGETTSVHFFTVTQNWAIFSFTLEPKMFHFKKNR